MPLDKRSRYRRTSLTWPAAITTVPGSQTSASALISLIGSPDSDMSTNRIFGLADTDSDCTALRRPPLRSEEHTSELQSLMRISYAVFCLKKKKHTTKKTHINRKRSQSEHVNTPTNNYT